jgi:sugar/nucleoside kinase (ribokinase family)
MSVLVVGSIALDTVKTPFEEHADLLGGSASYCAVAASFFSQVNLVGVVGKDFPGEHVEFFKSRGMDLAGLQMVDGETFRWSGEYMVDMNVRETRSIALNVFEHFNPVLAPGYAETPFVLLGNIGPDLQNHVLDQVKKPKFVIADTMDLWINIALPELTRLLKRVDMLILNDGEARLLTKETSLVKAGQKIQAMGPRFVAVKKGEHGCLLFGENGDFFSCGAYPLEDVHDPTGAGDSFAGGLAGYLASTVDGTVKFTDLRRAVVFGSVLASYNVEQFSLERMRTLTQKDIQDRYDGFRMFSHFEEIE